jgi:sulfatase maturation enzyme AslB (radical SAM superfamily)
MPIRLPFLETMITQACNLSCLGCTNYSDLPHSGYVSWAQGRASLERWLTRLVIDDFGIMGGEPLLNPEWRQWLIGVRELMPRAQIRFTTNGLLLHRSPDILDFLQGIGNVVFKITVHEANPQLEHLIDDFLKQRTWQPVTEHGVERLRTDNALRLHIKRPDRFLKTYVNSYPDMMPHHSDPQRAFDICVQKTCPLLYRDRIYKCSTSALLRDTLSRVGDPNLEHWQPYLTPGIGPDCSDQVIKEFVDNFGRAHAICGQCPSSEHRSSEIDHRATVSRRKHRIHFDAEAK